MKMNVHTEPNYSAYWRGTSLITHVAYIDRTHIYVYHTQVRVYVCTYRPSLLRAGVVVWILRAELR
jgi:hypothetical protein